MAAESSTAASSSRSGGGGASADSYIGSLISLTSKSEIRYEGILYNINTEESSIGLRNVRSFGTEGRKMDGPQVPPGDKIYEYILFRGSDIKDLQVKSSPPAQATPSINSDPAIIQSHYPRPTAPPTSLPTAPSGSLSDIGSHSSQVGLPGSTFQSGLPLYQPGGNMNSWGPSPPNANGSGLAMPMYWPGFYGTPNGLPQLPQQGLPQLQQQGLPQPPQQGLPQLPQQSLFRPPPGLSISPMQQMQFSGFNQSLPTTASNLHPSLPTTTSNLHPSLPTTASNLPGSKLPDYHSLVPNSTSSSHVTSCSLPTSSFNVNAPPLQPVSILSDTMFNPLPTKALMSAIPSPVPSSTLPSLAPRPISVPNNAAVPSAASRPNARTGASVLAPQTISRPVSSAAGTPSSLLTETPTPTLITPGQLLQSSPAAVSVPQPVQTTQKDVEVVQVPAKTSTEQSLPVVTQAQPPILPLPQNTRAYKPNGGAYHMRNNYRGRGGRGSGISRPVAKFNEDFDFMAMNEKFKKDEVWGHLGKSNISNDKDENGTGSDEEYPQDDYDTELPKIEIKPVYKKDDFFDSLSSNSLDNNDPNHGRPRYSEQMKLDTETFGDFSRFRGGRGGRGGGRFRGSYSGRGYGGYGHGGRGRGRGPQNRTS